ncbi:MAG: S49 family peptidase [Phycisphaerae bacterium]
MPETLNKHKIRRVVAAVHDTPWAIARSKLDAIVDLLERRAEGHLGQQEIETRLQGLRRTTIIEDDKEPYRITEEGVALIPLYGVLGPRMNWMMDFSGGTSTQEFAALVDEAAGDDRVRAIVLDVDSPGGNVLGTPEAAERVRIAAEAKPVLAVATGQMCSAAYYIGAAAHEVIASPSSQVGSIGVYTVHSDYSAADTVAGVKRTVVHAGREKARGNPHETLNQDGRRDLEQEADDYYQMFLDGVARYRGVSIETVERNFGQGRSLVAAKAKQAGLIDRVGTLSEIVAELGRKVRPAAEGSFTGPRAQEVFQMDPKLMEALRKKGLIEGNATKGEAMAALSAWYAAKGKEIPMAEGKIDVEAVEKDLFERLEKAEKSKAKETPLADPPPAPKAEDSPAAPPPAGDKKPDEKAIAAAERERIGEIRTRGKLLGCHDETIQAAVDDGSSLEKFLMRATSKAAEKETPVNKLVAGKSARDKFQLAAVDSLCLRGGVEVKQPAAGVEELQYHTLMMLGTESFRISCGRVPIGAPDDIARAALGDVEARAALGIYAADVPLQTPGDFPNILSAAANKVLEAAPQYVGTSYQRFAYRKPAVPDFKPSTLVRFGEFGEFPLHVDGDDFEQSELSEDCAWIQVDSYGDEFGLTPVMMVNDDLGAFMDALQDKQAAHDQTLNRLCVNLLTGNVAAADGIALFHLVSHGNDRAAGNPPSTTELSAMRLLLRQQTGVGGLRKLAYTLNLLLIPEALETTTQQLLAATLQIYPTTEGSTPIFKGQVDYAVETMLTDDSAVKYYGFATPARARSIVYCHQRGFERMRSRNYYNPKNNCRIFQFEGRFAAAINNYRGVVRNAGTGA